MDGTMTEGRMATGRRGGLVRAVLVACALVSPAAGAEAQTLREALALAYANNPTLQAARARLRATDENVPHRPLRLGGR
jgi:outer membrane protein